MVFAESFTAGVMCRFPDRLASHFDHNVHLVVDGHSAHRFRKVRDGPAAHPDDVELRFLPPYSPELNPDELVNADPQTQPAQDTLLNEPPDGLHWKSEPLLAYEGGRPLPLGGRRAGRRGPRIHGRQPQAPVPHPGQDRRRPPRVRETVVAQPRLGMGHGRLPTSCSGAVATASCVPSPPWAPGYRGGPAVGASGAGCVPAGSGAVTGSRRVRQADACLLRGRGLPEEGGGGARRTVRTAAHVCRAVNDTSRHLCAAAGSAMSRAGSQVARWKPVPTPP